MKRNNFIALTLFVTLSLCVLVTLSAELTLQQAAKALSDADGKLGNANNHLGFAHTEMHTKYVEWTQNEEELNRDNLIAASTARDPAALAALGIMHAADISDKLRLSRELAGKISVFNTKLQAVKDADKALQTAWNNYIPLAERHLSPGERYVIKNTAANPSPVSASLTCPVCNVTYSGENLGSIGDHITLCSVSGHKVSPYPYWSCESSGCPLSNEHHTFLCRGGCGKLFKQPTIISPPPASQGVVGGYKKIFHDDGYTCTENTGLVTICGLTAYHCKTPKCTNDANHLIDGACGRHKVRKGDAAAVAAHRRVGNSCPATYTYPSGRTISCVIYIGYKCDEHSIHDYDPGPGTNPPPESFDNTPNCSDCTSHCSSPCSCTNSGTCKGTVTPPTPTPPPKPKMRQCGNHTKAEGGDHSYDTCTHCLRGYWACSEWASRHTTQETCRRPGCGTTFYKCSNRTCVSKWGTRSSHWAR